MTRYTAFVQYEDDVQLQSPIGDAWAMDEPEPTNLIAVWPDAAVPTLAQVIEAMERFCGPVSLLDELDTDAPEIKWTAAIELPKVKALTSPVMIWAEPARPQADHPPAAMGCPWVLGMESLLDRSDPLASYVSLTRIIAGACPAIPAILDVNTLVWRERDELDRDFVASEIEPAADVMWTIHAVQQRTDPTASTAALTWLHTHGLWRCGLPEIEMLEVPAPHVPAAAMLLNDIAEMLLERGPSQPDEVLEIGAGLAVTMQPWEAVAPYIGEGVPGGLPDREGPHNQAHAGVRGVVCAAEPTGAFRKLWTWPQQVIQKLQSGEAALFMTHRATERQSKLAAKHWPDFQKAFADSTAKKKQATFLVKAVFEYAVNDEKYREHLWLELTHIRGGEAEGILLNEPIGKLALERGQRVTLQTNRITDWQVQSASRTFGPETADALLRSMSE